MTAFNELIQAAAVIRRVASDKHWGWILLFVLSLESLSPALGIPIDNTLIGSENKTECRNGKAIDLAFILDGSGSIGDVTFERQKEFVNMLVERMNVGLNSTRVATVQFSDEPVLEFGFSKHSNTNSLKLAVSKVKYLTGTTRTGEALRFAADNVFEKVQHDFTPTGDGTGSIGGGPVKTAIVITDGRAQDDVVEPAERLRSMGVILYAVGVTNFIDAEQLLQITGGAHQRVFTVDSFEKLDQPFSALLAKELCKTTYQGNLLDVVCGNDGIGIQARTKYPFEGNVFVKGFFHNKACRVDADSFLGDPTLVGITVPFNNCGVRRYRSLTPRGVFVETVVVFSFHPRFLTKVDQAIKVQCFYMEAQKTVQTDLEVSMFTPEFITRNVPMPTCFYSLRKEHPDGPLVRYAQIGDAIFHRWECVQQNEQQDLFGMLVHSCYAEDGEGNRVQLLDSKGCGLDIHVLATPIYEDSNNLRVAYQETHVFKFADKPILQFQCQVTICAKVDGGCTGVTPPDCSNNRARRSSRIIDSMDSIFDSLDVISDPITVFEVDSGPEDATAATGSGSTQLAAVPSSHRRTCFTYRIFIILLGLVLFLNFVIFSAICVCVRTRRRKRDGPV